MSVFGTWFSYLSVLYTLKHVTIAGAERQGWKASVALHCVLGLCFLGGGKELVKSRRVGMCLTIPGRVVSIRGEYASVDYGRMGVRENLNISMVSPKVGDYVLVQGGFVIKILTPKESREALEAWCIVQDQLSETDGGLF